MKNMDEFIFDNNEKKEVTNKELKNDINSLTKEINLLKNNLEEEESRLFNLRRVLLELLEINKIKNVTNENGSFSVSKRKSLIKFNLKRNFQDQSTEFKKELLEKGIIKEWYHLNLGSSHLENEEILEKINKYINYYPSDKYLLHKPTDKNNKLPKDDSSIGGITDWDINMGICSETKILVTSCMQECCMGEDEAEFCKQCGENLDGNEVLFEENNCDVCAEENEREESDFQNEILSDLYDLGVEMTNVDEMDISDYEKGLDY
tara:strand:- start:77 stop:865 length:789 start_codon:yes stop_codon:yes gene_type:complete